MALSPQAVEIPLAQSLDLKTDPKLVDAQHMLTMNNVRFVDANAVDKRYGQSKLTTLTNLTAPLNTTVVTQASENLLSYNQSTAGDALGTTAGFAAYSQGYSVFQQAPGGTITLSVVASPVFQGTKAIHFTSTSYQDDCSCVIPCRGSTQYTFSVYYYSNNSPGGQRLSVNMVDNAGTATFNNPLYTATGTWQRVSATMTTAPGATQLQVGIDWQLIGGTPDFYLDALQVEVGASASTWTAGAGAPTTYTTLQPQLLTQGKAIGRHNNELLTYDGAHLFGYSQASQIWLNRGAVTEVTMADAPVGLGQYSAQGCASAQSGNYVAYAWDVAGGGCYYAVQDIVTGNLVIPATALPQSQSTPYVFVIGGDFYIIYIGNSAIMGIRIDAGAPWQGPVNAEYVYLVGNYSVMTATSDGTSVWISTIVTPGIQQLSVTQFQFAPFQQTQSTLVSINPTSTLSSAVIGTVLYVGLMQSSLSRIYVEAFNTSNLSSAGNTPIAGTFTDSALLSNNGALQIYGVNGRAVQTSTLAGPVQSIASNLRPASGFVAVNGTTYGIFVTSQSTISGALSQQATYFFCSVSSAGLPQPLFRFYSDAAGSAGPTVALPALTYANGVFYVGLPRKTALRTDATGTVYAQNGIYGVQLSFPAQSTVTIQEAYGTALANIGNVYSYDGSILVEDGFWEFPEGLNASVISGGPIPAAAYFYQATYEWVDAAGNIHYSAPSFPVEVVTAAGSAVQITVPYTALTLKPNVTVNLYRSAANTSSPLYKVASVPNVLSNDSVIFTDALTDAQIQGQQFLYAPNDGSGELENDAPPPFRYLTLTKTRAFGIPQDDPYSLWFSKPLRPGRPVEWSSAQTIQIERQGGTPSGLGYVDTYAIVFKTSRMYYLYGDGPNAGGGGSAFGALQLISTTTGNTNSAAILNTTDGCFFQSATGLSLLQRGSLTPNAIFGLPVQPLVQSVSISGAVIVPAQNSYRWVTTQGTAIVYDYILQKWYTFDNYAAVGTIQWNNTAARLQANGVVYYEDTTTYLDDGSPVTMTLETAHLKLGQLTQGYAAVWYAEILGKYQDAHNLMIEIEYDFIGAPSQVYTFNAATNGNVGTFGSGKTYGSDPFFGVGVAPTYTAPYQIRVALQRQTCQSVKFKIYDSSITGRSATLNVLALQLGVIGGINRVPSRQQV